MTYRTWLLSGALAALLFVGGCTQTAFESAPLTSRTPDGDIVCQLYTQRSRAWDEVIAHPATVEKTEADQFCLRLGDQLRLQQKSAVVVDASNSELVPVTPPDSILQLGLFRLESNAVQAYRALESAGLDGRITRVTIGGEVYWRVIAGGVEDPGRFEVARSVVESLGINDAFVVSFSPI